MVDRNEGKLELTWSNKARRLVTLEAADERGYLYRWVAPTDYRAAEVRLLEELERVGDGSPNYLIRGDALHALEALNNDVAGPERMAGQVRLAYLDPPFNTGKAFPDYEDNLERSIWLTLMRDRLVQVKRLLHPDGSVWVHCDDSMASYLRVVMDEVFGPRNFVATFVWQKADSPSENKKPLAVDHDFILCYASVAGEPRLKRKPDPSVALAFGKVEPTSGQRYRDRLLKKNGKESLRRDRWSMWFPIPGPDGVPVFPIHDDGREARWSAGEETIRRWLAEDATIEDPARRNIIWIERSGHFVRTRPEPESEDTDDGLPRWRLEPDGTRWVPYTREWAPESPTRPWPTMWVSSSTARSQALAAEAIGDDEFTALDSEGPIAQALQEIAATDVLADVKTTRQAKQHLRKLFPGQALFETPKPEELMARIIDIASDEGDIVLDCFAGSGSTLTTAHKLGRRWIGVEMSAETMHTFALPRLRKVVSGEDEWGISPQVDWTGGGGFVYLATSASMFAEADGLVVLADWATGGQLAEAVAAQLGYWFDPVGPFSGRKGRCRLAVIDGLVNDGVVDLLVDELTDGEIVAIYGTAVDSAVAGHLADLRPGSSVHLIPDALLRTFGRPRRWRARTAAPEPAGETVAVA